MKYWWIRIFRYVHTSDDSKQDIDVEAVGTDKKGLLLDEYYLCGDDMTREEAKKEVVCRSGVDKFAKPRSKSGTYAIIMESNQFFYEREMTVLDTVCFNCHQKIQGKPKYFPKMALKESGKTVYFCSYACLHDTHQKLDPFREGEWQKKEQIEAGVCGYIYHIYNRRVNLHYIGQTAFAPFFRWQEHFKSGLKGEITDLCFETIAKVTGTQQALNDAEVWWIQKFIHDYGIEKVMNLQIPNITESQLLDEYNRIVKGEIQL